MAALDRDKSSINYLSNKNNKLTNIRSNKAMTTLNRHDLSQLCQDYYRVQTDVLVNSRDTIISGQVTRNPAKRLLVLQLANAGLRLIHRQLRYFYQLCPANGIRYSSLPGLLPCRRKSL